MKPVFTRLVFSLFAFEVKGKRNENRFFSGR